MRTARERPTAADAQLAALARALGHPARVAILRQLAERGTCVCGEIVSALPLAQATVSQHLQVLREAGLVRGTLDPPRVCYCADPATLERFRRLVAALPAPRPASAPGCADAGGHRPARRRPHTRGGTP